jgi:hypothetical protein
MVSGRSQQRLNEGQGNFATAAKGTGEAVVGAIPIVGQVYGVAVGHYEAAQAYSSGQISFEQYDRAISQIAGGASGGAALASMMSAASGNGWRGGQSNLLYRGDDGSAGLDSHALRLNGADAAAAILRSADIRTLMAAHAADSRNPASPFLSLTTDPRVAAFFANKGQIYQMMIGNDRGFANYLNNMLVPAGRNGMLIPEAEWLVRMGVRPDEILRSAPNGQYSLAYLRFMALLERMPKGWSPTGDACEGKK